MITAVSLQNTKQVPSYVMLGVPKPDEPSKAPPSPTPQPQHPLSAMGEACSRMDLTAIHQILVSMHYRDDEGSNEVKSTAFCFQHVLSAVLYLHRSPHIAAIVPRMDTADEGYVGCPETGRLCFPRQGL